jgi:hypothetical protein
MAEGRKTGGRKKGTPNKATGKRAAEIVASGLMPLDYMLQVLRNEDEEPARRAWAAKEAAPYLHPKLAQVDIGNKGGRPFVVALGAEDGGVL